jgi:PAS domain S-box-containing protein
MHVPTRINQPQGRLSTGMTKVSPSPMNVDAQMVLENAPASIMALDSDGLIVFMNQIHPEFDKTQVIGTPFLNYIPVERRAHAQAVFESVLALGVARTYETTAIAVDGSEVWFESRMGPIQRDGKVVGAVVVADDVTEKKRTQAELASSRHMAVLGTLVAGVAHEINTPVQFVGDSITFLREATDDLLKLIGVVQGFRMSLLDRQLTPEALAAAVPHAVESALEAEKAADLPYLRERMPKAFDRCAEGLERVATIVRSLKAFAHPAGLEMVEADLNQAIGDTLIIAKNEYKYVADVDADFGELPPVKCHLSEINQVVLNILVNAAHAISDLEKVRGGRGVIKVRTRKEGNDAVISIGDTGGGIPEEIRGRIFDPFFTTKELGRGTGQGLAIAQNMIVNQHAGQLTFDTAVGKGTTFFIRLPVAGKPASPA